MKKLIECLIVILAIVAPLAARANWGGSANFGSFGSGHLEAIGTKEVELLNEDLNIDLYKDHATVTVEYTFHNTGNDVVVKAGFPNIIYGGKNEIDDYSIEVEGTKLPYKHVKGGEIKNIPLPYNLTVTEEDEKDGKLRIGWLVSEVQFKHDEEKKIKISYSSHYQMSVGGVSDDSDFDPETFRYLLSTGAAWKGPIKKGTIIIKAVSVDPSSFILNPLGKFKRNDNTFTWQFENLKPTRSDDIIVNFNNPVSVKMNYEPEDEFGFSYYVLQEKQNKYYYVTHSYTPQASSTLKPSERYSAGNVKDMTKLTGWCEGKEDDGIGEYLVLTLKKPAEISQIGIIPGYEKSQETYFNNNRVAEVTAIINDIYKVRSSFSDEYASYGLQHPKAYQYIDISGYKGPVKTIKLIIEKIYQGAKFHDTCISKVILQKEFKSKPAVQGAR